MYPQDYCSMIHVIEGCMYIYNPNVRVTSARKCLTRKDVRRHGTRVNFMRQQVHVRKNTLAQVMAPRAIRYRIENTCLSTCGNPHWTGYQRVSHLAHVTCTSVALRGSFEHVVQLYILYITWYTSPPAF